MSDVSDYSPKCIFCHENSFEIHDGATFCINCGTESKEHGQELVYEIQDLIEDPNPKKMMKILIIQIMILMRRKTMNFPKILMNFLQSTLILNQIKL